LNKKPAVDVSERSRNISSLVSELICSQEDTPDTSRNPREIEKVAGVSRCSATERFQTQESPAAAV